MLGSPYPLHEVKSWSTHVVTTHGAELGHFQNDTMLTDTTEATIHDNDITFDLF